MNDLISRVAVIEALTGWETDPTDEEIEWAIKAVPAADAISVEWLKRRRDIYLKAYHAGHESEIHTAAILNDTLMAWQKEQEATNETCRP